MSTARKIRWRTITASAMASALTMASLLALPSRAADVEVTQVCSPSGTLEKWGSPLINDTLVDTLESQPLHLPFPVSATASPYVDPAGGVIDYDVTIDLDFQAATDAVLTDYMSPMLHDLLISWGFVPPELGEAAASSYLIMRYHQPRFIVPLPEGTTLEGEPSVSATGGLGFTATSGANGVEAALVHPSGGLSAASYGTPGPGVVTTTTLPPLPADQVTVHFSVRTPPGLGMGEIIELGPMAFTTYLEVEPGFIYNNQLLAMVEGPFACEPSDEAAVLAATEVGVAPATSSPPSSASEQTRSSTARGSAPATLVTPRFAG